MWISKSEFKKSFEKWVLKIEFPKIDFVKWILNSKF